MLLAVAMEAASRDFGDLQRGGGSTEMEKMNYISKLKSSKPPRKGHKETSKPSIKSEKPISTAVCWRCGGSHSARRCRWKDEKCYNCQQRGHMGKKSANVK